MNHAGIVRLFWLTGKEGSARHWQCEANSIRGRKKMSYVRDSFTKRQTSFYLIPIFSASG